MDILTQLSELKSYDIGAATIGNFDGLHLGHRALIERTVLSKGTGQSLLITFDPHPREVLNPGTRVPRLSLWPEILHEFQSLNVDLVLRLKFDRPLARTSAEDFLNLIWDSSQLRTLIVGHDFALGADRKGDAHFMRDWAHRKNVHFSQLSPIQIGNETVSSQRIREFLNLGNIEKANQFLGRNYSVRGEVIHGDGRGKSLNFPTANLKTASEKIKPALGVYAGWAIISGKKYCAVSNIGTKPTFVENNPEVSFEVHILNFASEIYGQELEFELHSRIRAEKKFSSREELIDEISSDIRIALERLK